MSRKLSILLSILILFAYVSQCHPGHDHDHDHDHDHEHHEEGHHHSHVIKLTGQDIQSHIDENSLILIKFFAPWCGHCKTLAPTYIEIAEELAHQSSQIIIAHLDCTQHRDACTKFGIKGYPTLKYFIDGEAHQYSGSRSKESIITWLKSKPVEARIKSNDQQL